MHDIQSVAKFLEQHVNQHYDAVFQGMKQEMIDLYPTLGDTVYGKYIDALMRPAIETLKAKRVKSRPRLPGSLMPSREWGAETERQRWMWSKISTEDRDLGTIAFGFYHDHEQIRIPRAPQIVALDATAKRDVIAALSAQFPEFADAIDMKQEIAEYMAQMGHS